MKKTITWLLVFVLCMGLLAGCGKQADKETEDVEAHSAEVYTAAFGSVKLPEESWLQAFALGEEGALLAVHEKLSDGETPEGVTPAFEGQFAVYGIRLYRAAADGSLTALAFELPDSFAQDGGQENVSSSIVWLSELPDGDLLALREDWRSWYAGPAGKSAEDEDYWNYMRSESSCSLLRLNARGELLGEAELALPPESENTYLDFSGAVLDSEGRLFVGGDAGVYVFDGEGALTAQIGSDDWVNELVAIPDGRVLATVYGMRGLEFREVDADKRSFGARYAMSDSPNRLFAGNGEWDLLYTGGAWLCGYTLSDQRSEKLVDLLSCDVLADDLLQLAAEPDGSLRGFCWDRRGADEKAPTLVTLTKGSRESAAERTVLTLGALNPDVVSRAVLAFNRSQEKVRIELRDYSDLVYGGNGDETDYENAMTKLVTEILSGKMPDLLMLEGLPYRQLAVKGLLEDLYPYLDADPALSREDLFESVLKSMEVGGGLYELSPSFSLMTLMGASSVVGDTPGWTYDELNAALASMPDGCTVLGPHTGRDEMLSMCVYLEMDKLVNWETGECRFDSEDFVKLLEFVSGFPEEVSYEGDGSENAMTRIASGKQLLADVNIYDLDELCFNEQIFGGEATYIGFPTSEGVGNLLYANGGIAMSSRCADKEAAWQFLRQFLSADYEEDAYGGLPINRARMDARIAEAMKTEYERDENGKYKLDPDTGERIPLPKGGMGMSEGGDAVMEFTIWPMTERQRDKLLELIEESTRSVDMNTHIYGIVREEAEAFFAGQRSAEETAGLIQSKVKLYVNEQR